MSQIKAPAAASVLLASYQTPLGATVELRKGEHGYYTVRTMPDGSATGILVDRERALEHYQMAVRDGETWQWQ